MEDYSAQLARWAANFRLADAPPEVVKVTKRVILDQLGCEVASSTLPWSMKFREAVLSTGTSGGATVVYHGDKVSLDNAAFLNSQFGHGNEMDDACVRTPSHSGSVVIPTVNAVAEHVKAPGTKMLEAVIVGYEVMMRVSYATSPYLRTQGHHGPPAVGPFGSAAAAAHLLGLDEAQTLNAIAIAGSHAAGLLQYTRGGGSVKRIHCAIPAMSGLRSAVMASKGITGPPTVLEGEKGFCKVFAGDCTLPWLTRGLGSEFVMLETAFKRYSCCFHSHTALEALDTIREAGKLKADDIEKITVGVSAEGAHHFFQGPGHPKDILSAQFCMGHILALRMLRKGNGFWDWHEEDLVAPDIIDFAKRVETVVDDIANKERHDNFGSVVYVTTRDGREFEERLRYSKGLPQNPLTEAEFLAKFTDLVTPQLGAGTANKIIETVERLDSSRDSGALMSLLVRQAVAAK